MEMEFCEFVVILKMINNIIIKKTLCFGIIKGPQAKGAASRFASP